MKAGVFVTNLKKILVLISALLMMVSVMSFSAGAEVYSGKTSAKAAVMMEADTGQILYAVNPSLKLPMASTTKIMTALITLEQPNLDEEFVVDKTAIRVEGSSMGLKEGDVVTLRALATGMLLVSGNDAANAAAVRIAGSLPAFAQLMNQKAQELGMTNTHFVTPSGLDDKDHYSTAEDMAKLAAAALQNEEFISICSSKSIRLTYGGYTRRLHNSNKMLKLFEGAIGVKTGFTKKSGRCLVSAAERDGIRLIVVTLCDPDDWDDHTNLLNAGFEALQPVELCPKDLSYELAVAGTGKTVRVVPKGDQVIGLTAEDLARLKRVTWLPRFVYAPVQKGDRVGQLCYYLDGKLVGTCPLVSEDVMEIPEKKSFWDRILAFLGLAD